MLKVIGSALSPWVRRVIICLEEKGIAYEHEDFFPVGDLSAEFQRKSPLGLVPVLDTDQGSIADSTAICAYIEAAHPDPSLLPTDAYTRARAAWICEYADALFRHEGPLFFQQVVRGHLMGQEPDRLAVETAAAAVPRFLEYLDGELKDCDYFCGAEMTLADITAASVLLNYLHTGAELDATLYPDLDRFLENMFDRPTFRARIADDLKMLAGISSLTMGR